MANGIKINIGGRLDKSFSGAFSEAEREARSSAIRIQRVLQSQITGLQNKNPGGMMEGTAHRLAIEQDIASKQKTLLTVQNAEFVRAAKERIAIGKNEWRERTAQMRANAGLSSDSFMGGGSGGTYRGPGRARAIGGASSAMFISVARDTMASLASGANPITVFMQQAPQVLQAITMMGFGLKLMLGILGSVGVAMAAAFATHIISNGVAAMVYGLDKIAARSERLESMRKILHKLVEEMKEAAKLKVELYGEEFEGKEKEKASQAKKRAAELAAFKAELEKKNIAGQKLGNLDNSTADKISALEKERGYLKEDLADAEKTGTSPEVVKLQQELEELNSKPEKTMAEYDRLVSLPDQIAKATSTDALNRQTAIQEAQTKLQENQNEIDSYGIPGKKTEETKNRGQRLSESSLERSGIFANAGAARAHDTLREQLKELKHINRNTTGLGGKGQRGGTRF